MKMAEYPNNKEDVDLDYLNMMLHNFNHAIKTGSNLVYLGYSYLEDDDEHIKEYWCQKKDWSKTLNILIESAAILEEYEFANEFKKIKNDL